MGAVAERQQAHLDDGAGAMALNGGADHRSTVGQPPGVAREQAGKLVVDSEVRAFAEMRSELRQIFARDVPLRAALSVESKQCENHLSEDNALLGNCGHGGSEKPALHLTLGGGVPTAGD
jgi:hypothetical protein